MAQSPSFILRALMAATAATLMSACVYTIIEANTDPLVGDWRADTDVDGYADQLTFYPDMTGSATFYVVDGEEAIAVEYTSIVTGVETLGGRQYDVALYCEGDCEELDFELRCVLHGWELSCDSEGPVRSLEFLRDC